MFPVKDQVFSGWWPLMQALTVVRAPFDRTAYAVQADMTRIANLQNRKHDFEWVKFESLDHLFRDVRVFPNWPIEIVLPTQSPWTVIWPCDASCAGGGSIGARLARFQELEGLDFYSTDCDSTQLAGTSFTHFTPNSPDNPIERNVYCCNQGSRWHFEQHGTPLPEEDVARYDLKRKRDRLNEEQMMLLLQRMGVHPWREATYDFSQVCFCVDYSRRLTTPNGCTFEQIRARAMISSAPKEDEKLTGPPDYLQGKCAKAKQSGPSALLRDGKWCGHGEQEFWIYDIALGKCKQFQVQLPAPGGPQVVRATAEDSQEEFAIYDSRRHPANAFVDSKEDPVMQAFEKCPQCSSTWFNTAVGFEVPPDASSRNDTSWFALAVKCLKCANSRIIYDDETA
jgi:hypothetical protein